MNYSNNGTYGFSACKDYFRALDDSLYSLWQLIEDLQSQKLDEEVKRARAIYHKLLKIIED